MSCYHEPLKHPFLMSKSRLANLPLLVVLGVTTLSRPGCAQPMLGDAPRVPHDVAGLPKGGVSKQSVTGGFSVNTTSREETRGFYNAIYPSSDNVLMDTTADVSTCTPGTNSTAFQQAVLRRINWFRAMAGVPAAVTLNPLESAKNQQGAVLMSANNALSHFPPSSWSCFTPDAANAASNSNIALGYDGAAAITGYIWDFGANNYEVGHRRWILYPQTQVMGTGDVPQTGSFNAANTTWVFDGNLFGPRPATRQPYVAWPPQGFVPYQVVFPQWSLALSNADFSAATVTMTSNGVSVAVSQQPYVTGYGENTLVWVPMGLDPTTSTVFPFNGTDTIYGISVANIAVGTTHLSISYNVTVFDPAVPGADYIATTVTGPTTVGANTTDNYAVRPPNNSHVSSYQWRVSQLGPGNLVDKAQNGLTNFSISPPPDYPIITNAPDGSGNCFHLAHPDPTEALPQLLQLSRVLLPSTNGSFSFSSLLGYATSDEVARVQASTDGGSTWLDLYTQPGSGGAGESTFTRHTFSLAGFAGQPTLLRFNYDFQTGSYFTSSAAFVGWCLENTVVTNAQQLVSSVTNSTPSTSFVFTPTQAGNFSLESQAVIFTEFPLGWGPALFVTVVPSISLHTPVLNNGQVRLDFTVSGAESGTFKLLQAGKLGSGWNTNITAVLTTNIPGASYRFTTSINGSMQFYRVLQTP